MDQSKDPPAECAVDEDPAQSGTEAINLMVQKPEKITHQVDSLKIEVLKSDHDLAVSFGFDPFSYIPLTSVLVDSLFQKNEEPKHRKRKLDEAKGRTRVDLKTSKAQPFIEKMDKLVGPKTVDPRASMCKTAKPKPLKSKLLTTKPSTSMNVKTKTSTSSAQNLSKPIEQKLVEPRPTTSKLTKTTERKPANLKTVLTYSSPLTPKAQLSKTTQSTITEPKNQKADELKSKPTEPNPKPKSVITAFPFKKIPVTRVQPETDPSSSKAGDAGRSVVDDILGVEENTTSKHVSHLYDANCDICRLNDQQQELIMEKMAKTKEDRQREKTNRRLSLRESRNYKRRSPAIETSIWESPPIALFSTPQHESSGEDVPEGINDDILLAESSSTVETPAIGSTRTFFPPPTTSTQRRSSRIYHSPDMPQTTVNFDQTPSPMGDLQLDYSHRDIPNNNERQVKSWRDSESFKLLNMVDRNLVLEPIWNGSIEWAGKYVYHCDLMLIWNRVSALELQKELPLQLNVRASCDFQSVWQYMETVKTQWNKQIITLLVHPPKDEEGYRQYIQFYQELLDQRQMAVVNVDLLATVKDIFLFALPPAIELPPYCQVGDGPGLSSAMKSCGNLIALIVRYANQRIESWRDPNAPLLIPRLTFFPR